MARAEVSERVTSDENESPPFLAQGSYCVELENLEMFEPNRRQGEWEQLLGWPFWDSAVFQRYWDQVFIALETSLRVEMESLYRELSSRPMSNSFHDYYSLRTL